jgi:hypothetical protein
MFRGARLWLLLRVLLTVFFFLDGSPSIRVPLAVLIAIILLSVFISFLDTYRYRERVLLGNLGLRPAILGILFFIPAAIGEGALRIGSVLFQ